MRLQGLIVVGIIVSMGACANAPTKSTSTSHQNIVITTKENSEHKLTSIFYGHEVGVGDRKVKVIDSMTVRDDRSGQETGYEPEKGAVMDAGAYFTEVWSPNGEYFVSLRGRTQGFCIIKSSELLEDLRKKSCSDFIRVQSDNQTYLWHEFEKWNSDGTFTFKAGLSGDYFPFRYDIPRQELRNLDSRPHSTEAENSKGKVRIIQD